MENEYTPAGKRRFRIYLHSIGIILGFSITSVGVEIDNLGSFWMGMILMIFSIIMLIVTIRRGVEFYDDEKDIN